MLTVYAREELEFTDDYVHGRHDDPLPRDDHSDIIYLSEDADVLLPRALFLMLTVDTSCHNASFACLLILPAQARCRAPRCLPICRPRHAAPYVVVCSITTR